MASPVLHFIKSSLINLKERYTEAVRSQHLTQGDPRIFGASYVASCSAADGKSAFLNEPARHDGVEYFQSHAQFRLSGLPRQLPSEKAEAVESHPELLRARDNVRELKESGANKVQIRQAKSQAQAIRSTLKRRTLKQYQDEWVQSQRRNIITEVPKATLLDHNRTDLLEILVRIAPELGRLAETMISENVASPAQRKQNLKDLYQLITRDFSVLYLPGESPTNGRCGVCKLLLSSLNNKDRSRHVHQCHCKQKAYTLQRSKAELHYCYLCFDWHVEEQWEDHCRHHLRSLNSKRCGWIFYSYTLLRPCFCPFCMGNEDIKASARMQTWVGQTTLEAHIREKHARALRFPTQCPFPSCNVALEREPFRHHLQDAHCLKLKPNTLERIVQPMIHLDTSTILRKQGINTVIPRRHGIGSVPLKEPNIIDTLAPVTTISPHLLVKHRLERGDKARSPEPSSEEPSRPSSSSSSSSSSAEFEFPNAIDLLAGKEYRESSFLNDGLPSPSIPQMTPIATVNDFANRTIPQVTSTSVSPIWPIKCTSPSPLLFGENAMEAQSKELLRKPSASSPKETNAMDLPSIGRSSVSQSQIDQVVKDSAGGQSSATKLFEPQKPLKKRKSSTVDDKDQVQHMVANFKKPRLILRLNPPKAEKATETPGRPTDKPRIATDCGCKTMMRCVHKGKLKGGKSKGKPQGKSKDKLHDKISGGTKGRVGNTTMSGRTRSQPRIILRSKRAA